MIDRKVGEIRSHFAAVVGSRILRCETAELLLEDGTWHAWPDLPIRIHLDNGRLIAISWSEFDHLWIAADPSLPFSTEGSTVRWVADAIEAIRPALGGTIRGVMLGRDEMIWDGKGVEIWMSLLIELDGGWLEVFNALDENGYAFHDRRPAGHFVPCL